MVVPKTWLFRHELRLFSTIVPKIVPFGNEILFSV